MFVNLCSKLIRYIFPVGLVLILTPPSYATILKTKHNLSVKGPGTLKSQEEQLVCIFCHTPHSAKPKRALWNQKLPSVTYKIYTSSTLDATMGQPTGSSKLCLSCHDGTIAPGSFQRNRRGSRVKAISKITGRLSLGTDLSDDHPVSFVYDSALAAKDEQLVDPKILRGKIRLDENSELQCTTCHDAHNDGFGKFLVVDNRQSALCTACHNLIGWKESSHARSNARWNGKKQNPWPESKYATVSDNGCSSCHKSHNAGHPERLLSYPEEEKNCLICHNDAVASTDIESLLNRLSSHRVMLYNGVHDMVEDPTRGMASHVECTDCHNPHRVKRSSTRFAPLIMDALKGVSGIDSSGIFLKEARYEYEVCFKCHGVDGVIAGKATVLRVEDERNVRRKFSPSNASSHPVVRRGNGTSASLLPFLRSNPSIYCSDCHGNSDPSGPRGPHGSSINALLERGYITSDNTVEGVNAYALCYKCHDRTVIMSDRSFRGHWIHVIEQRTPCSACHDAHGSKRNPALINFDRTIVKPSSSGRIEFVKRGSSVECYLNCHGTNHNPKGY